MLEQVSPTAIDADKSLDTRTLKEQVVRLLRTAILSGKISAGGRLNESQLARELGVSRVPIREALQQLEQQGLVVNVPRRGKFVISLSDEEIQKINSLRLILEAEALRLCRAKINAEGIATLNDLNEKMQKAGGLPEIEAAALDLEFHRTIWRYSGNEYLGKTLEKHYGSAIRSPRPMAHQPEDVGLGEDPSHATPIAAGFRTAPGF